MSAHLTNLIRAIHQHADDNLTPDELLAEAGIATDYTCDELCPECGNAISEPYIETSGEAYGRPDRTVNIHAACA